MQSTAIVGVIVAAIAVACSDSVTPPVTARVLWHVAGAGGAGRPVADDSTVYFVAAADSHAVHAFDIATGKSRWNASTGATGVAIFSQGGCLLGSVIVACGDGTDVVGLAKSDGHLVWSFRPAIGRYPGVYISTMDSARTTIFAPSPQNMVHALDAATGQVKWSVPVIAGDTNLVVYKVVDGGDVVFAPFTIFSKQDTGGVVALSKVDGAVRWPVKFSRTDSAFGAKDIALWGNDVLVSLENGRIAALDRSSGQVVWELPSAKTYAPWVPVNPGVVAIDLRTLVVSGNTLTAIGENSGWVVSYDLTTHLETSRGSTAHSAGALWASSSDGMTGYFLSSSSMLFSFEIGKPTSVAPASGLITFLTAPTLTTDRLFIGGVDGYYALKR